MKKHVSQEWNLGTQGHNYFDFVDVNVLDDQKLFIDPCLIETSNSVWCQKAHRTVSSFFDNFYNAYRTKNLPQKRNLFSHASEINFTRLGYGRGDNGHGNTVEGLIEKFISLDGLSNRILTISNAIDLPVLIPSFDKDGLSDMLTNIIHKELNDFTLEQCKKWNKQPNGMSTFWTWDATKAAWLEVDAPCYIAPKGKLLLVPKEIVRFRYICNVRQFFSRVILERMQNDRAYTNEKGKIQLPHKKDIEEEIVKKGNNWRYEYAVSYSVEHPDALHEYHRRIPEYYSGKSMSDAELNQRVYGN